MKSISLIKVTSLLFMVSVFIGMPVTRISAQEKITVMDLAGKTVAVKVPLKRIVVQGSGSGGPFFTMIALLGAEAPDRIVGMDPGLQKNRNDMWRRFSEAYPKLKTIPDVGDATTLNIEKVISLKPDAVITSSWSLNAAPEMYRKLERIGIPVVSLDFHAEIQERHAASILLMGRILGREARAKELLSFYNEQCDFVSKRIRNLKSPKPTVYIESGYKGFSEEYDGTYGEGMWAVLVDRAGGANVAKGVVKMNEPISPEFLLKKDPDIIIITGSYWPAVPKAIKLGYFAEAEAARPFLKAYTGRRGWSSLKAVKEGRLYSINHGLARDVWDFFPVLCFAKWFHPTEFEDLDPVAVFKDFHRRFLGIEYSGTWSMELKK